MPAIEFHCDWFVPCPLCSKCTRAANHLYKRCQKCAFGMDPCHHTQKDINTMIKRPNFKLTLPEDVKKQIKELSDANDRRSEN
jgi:predicted amidophosphoribosyltransferase